jgi:hypothetical protein
MPRRKKSGISRASRCRKVKAGKLYTKSEQEAKKNRNTGKEANEEPFPHTPDEEPFPPTPEPATDIRARKARKATKATKMIRKQQPRRLRKSNWMLFFWSKIWKSKAANSQPKGDEAGSRFSLHNGPRSPRR